ncbi:MAG TPA: universal stress protein [Candidatus Bathyarchaeia archaeon]|nr:universal stress protein [Candidatus Bathyarchaeia archaeon]
MKLMQSMNMKSGKDSFSVLSRAPFKKILVAVDGSDSSKRAAFVALGLAEGLKAELILLHAISPPTKYYGTTIPTPSGVTPPPVSQHEIDAYYEYARRAAEAMVADVESQAKKGGVNVRAEFPQGVGSVVETIINHADNEKADLIVVGTRGLGGFKKLLIGSVSNGVVSHASTPVLVVR